MPTYKSYEPRQRGVPSPRYSRPLIRANGLTQDANCIQFSGLLPIEQPIAKLGWGVRNDANLIAPTSSLNSGTMPGSFYGHTLAFGLTDMPALDTGVYTITTAFSGDTSGWGVTWTGTSGVVSLPGTVADGPSGGVVISLLRNGVVVGQLQAVVVVQSGNFYGNTSWLAYSPV